MENDALSPSLSGFTGWRENGINSLILIRRHPLSLPESVLRITARKGLMSHDMY